MMKQNTTTPSDRTTPEQRRGSALVVMVVVLAILGIVVAGAVRPLVYEAETVSLRVETVRAFYAAESGGGVVLQSDLGVITAPVDGDTVVLEGSVIRYMQMPLAGSAAIIEGTSGSAVRRIEMQIE